MRELTRIYMTLLLTWLLNVRLISQWMRIFEDNDRVSACVWEDTDVWSQIFVRITGVGLTSKKLFTFLLFLEKEGGKHDVRNWRLDFLTRLSSLTLTRHNGCRQWCSSKQALQFSQQRNTSSTWVREKGPDCCALVREGPGFANEQSPPSTVHTSLE